LRFLGFSNWRIRAQTRAMGATGRYPCPR